jgi:hypothetical protein
MAQVGSNASNSRAAPAPPSRMTEKQLLSLAFGGNAFETMSSLVPIQEEIRQYLRVMNTASSKMDLPLPLWTTHAERFPILFRIARRVLSTPTSSTDVKRMFSACGLIYALQIVPRCLQICHCLNIVELMAEREVWLATAISVQTRVLTRARVM